MHLSITPTSLSTTTTLWLGHGLLQQQILPHLIQQWGSRAVIIASHSVASLFGTKLAEKHKAELLVIPENGKPLKSRENKAYIEDELLARKCGRDTVLLALGGGATTDLVGFVASTYLRGVPLIFLPTTLLAMVDASIGGKTSIDAPQGKNLIGTYYTPKAVISDLDLLSSLPTSEWQNGLAEIIKAALIADSSLWPLCDASWRSKLELIVEKAIHVKISTIEKDPQEKGLRRILNYGHTVAHALEAVADYQIAHGEAVAIGLLAESYLSMRLGLLTSHAFHEIDERIKGANFPLQLPSNYNRISFLQAMQHDKKSAKGIVRFTLLTQIGKAGDFEGHYCRPASQEMLQEMSEWMEQL